MVSALILVVSIAALAQFGIFTWRMAVITLAAEPLSEVGQTAITPNITGDNDFRTLAALNSICPELKSAGSKLWFVCAYYRGVQALDRLSSTVLPSVSGWTHDEMALCARYLAVVMDQRLQRNLTCFAEVRSY